LSGGVVRIRERFSLLMCLDIVHELWISRGGCTDGLLEEQIIVFSFMHFCLTLRFFFCSGFLFCAVFLLRSREREFCLY
jgi:hypothetical protein